MSAIAAASTLAEMSNWTLSNLQLQKLLYLAQMFHLGEHQEPIFSEDFEAWKLGPVIPSVYRHAKIYGSQPVESFFTNARLSDGTGKAMLRRTLDELPDLRPWRLVSITHWDKGAWAKHYTEGSSGATIPKKDILDEYWERGKALQSAKAH